MSKQGFPHLPECVYMIHISVYRNKIICIRNAAVCQISDGQLVPLPWKQNIINIFIFFLFMAFVNQTWVS